MGVSLGVGVAVGVTDGLGSGEGVGLTLGISDGCSVGDGVGVPSGDGVGVLSGDRAGPDPLGPVTAKMPESKTSRIPIDKMIFFNICLPCSGKDQEHLRS